MRPEVLFLLVAYNNKREIAEFVRDLSGQGGGAVGFAVCDNSPAPLGWEGTVITDYPCVSRPDNPGYLEGALLALENYVTRQQVIPRWIVLCNSDLELDFQAMKVALRERFDHRDPVVVAPRITDISTALERNPHLLKPRSALRMWLNRAVTCLTPLAYCYLVARAVRQRHARKGLQHPSAGQRMYAPYGAFMVFSIAFFESPGLPCGVPLFAEEYVVAEVARRAEVPVVFEPAIHVHHRGNATTGPQVSWRRAGLVRQAFKFMNACVRCPVTPKRGQSGWMRIGVSGRVG